MGRSPCCAKEGLNKGAWSATEDKILTDYISVHGEGKWRDLPQSSGLKRCGKSCRLRWLNYLRPDIKRGNISVEEEDLIIKLHKLLGNRWSLIAGRLPGRTDNEIKNYWNTNLSKKGERAARAHHKRPQDSSNKDKQSNKNKEKKGLVKNSSSGLIKAPEATIPHHRVIRTKAVRCTTTRVNVQQQHSHNHMAIKENLSPDNYLDRHDTTTSTSASSSAAFHDDGDDDPSNFMMDIDINDLLISDILNSSNGEYAVDGDHHCISNNNMSSFGRHDDEAMLDESTNEIRLYENLMASTDQLNEAMELKTLASFFNSEEI